VLKSKSGIVVKQSKKIAILNAYLYDVNLEYNK